MEPNPPARRPRPFLLLLALVVLSAAMPACQRQLMRAPVMFHQSQADPFDQLPESKRTPAATIFYATNRTADPESTEEPYGRARAAALTLGRLEVEIGKQLGWEQLIDKTLGPRNSDRPPLHIEPPHEFGPLLTTAPPRVIRQAAAANQTDEDASEKDLQVRFMPRLDPGRGAFRFGDAINREMAETQHPDIYVYVHGYRNSYSDAVESAASLHHYNGRRGAVIAFSWPSQKHLLDYLEDRESAQFAVSDLRQLLVFLADHTDAERIHLIAHSMGTFLTSNALRELRLIGFEKSPEELHERFRIDNVVLVAPDIDVDVLQKRFFREGFHHSARRLTIYVSPDDQALAWATRLLYGISRAGSVTGDYLSETQQLWLKAHRESVAIVDISGQKTYGLGHSHHTENPGVASDLLLLLAHDLPPAKRGLRLAPRTGVWSFPEGYTPEVQRIAERYYPPRTSASTARKLGAPRPANPDPDPDPETLTPPRSPSPAAAP
ncbi:MAG: alpha/beta fold hydrolase [Planctomycetota bacterium]